MPKKTNTNMMLRRDHLVDIILPIMIERFGAHLARADERAMARRRIAEEAVGLAQVIVTVEDEEPIT